MEYLKELAQNYGNLETVQGLPTYVRYFTSLGTQSTLTLTLIVWLIYVLRVSVKVSKFILIGGLVLLALLIVSVGLLPVLEIIQGAL